MNKIKLATALLVTALALTACVKNTGLEDRVKNLEEKAKGLEDRTAALEAKAKGLEDRVNVLEPRTNGQNQ